MCHTETDFLLRLEQFTFMILLLLLVKWFPRFAYLANSKSNNCLYIVAKLTHQQQRSWIWFKFYAFQNDFIIDMENIWLKWLNWIRVFGVDFQSDRHLFCKKTWMDYSNVWNSKSIFRNMKQMKQTYLILIC